MKAFTVEIDGKAYPCSAPVRVIDLIRADADRFGDAHRYISCVAENRDRELTFTLRGPASVQLLAAADQAAVRTYESSLRFLTVMACDRVFPGKKVKLCYHMARSVYLNFSCEPNEYFDEAKLALLERQMHALTAMDLPFTRRVLTREEAQALYEKQGDTDKAALLRYRPQDTVHFYECDGYLNYMYGYCVPSTGHIAEFRLTLYEGGVIVQYPRSETGGRIPPFETAPVYARTLEESYRRSKLMRTDTIPGINLRVEKDGPVDFVSMCEAYHGAMFADLGRKIEERRQSIRLICIAGPSSSGKTTFSNRLRVDLMSRGMTPLRISLDDYYRDRDLCPLDEDGKPDFECLEALDTDRFNRDMKDLIDGKTVALPAFDFLTGKSIAGRTVSLGPGEPVIVEGIHALNEKMTALIPPEQKYRIFIAPSAQVNFDNHTPISLTDLRLLRRIVRDYLFRGTPVEQTVSMWPSVRRGEFRWIYDTQENADFVFNSLLPYELCVMKKHAMPLLSAVPEDSPYFVPVNRLTKFLKFFDELDDTWVPCNSILREFIGGSCFADV